MAGEPKDDNEITRLKDFYDLQPHPEGGYYKESYRSEDSVKNLEGDDRAASTAIFFLVTKESVSRLHKIKSDEMWHFYKGCPLCVIEMDTNKKTFKRTVLGHDESKGELLQYVVPKGTWFGCYPLTEGHTSNFCLVGCTVAPGFDFADFQLADRKELLELYKGDESCCEMIEKLCVGL